MKENLSLLNIIDNNEDNAKFVISSRIYVLKALRHDLANIAAVLEFDNFDLETESYSLKEIKNLIFSLDELITYYKNIDSSFLAKELLDFFGKKVDKGIESFPINLTRNIKLENITIINQFSELLKTYSKTTKTKILDIDLLNIFLSYSGLQAASDSSENIVTICIKEIDILKN